MTQNKTVVKSLPSYLNVLKI